MRVSTLFWLLLLFFIYPAGFSQAANSSVVGIQDVPLPTPISQVSDAALARNEQIAAYLQSADSHFARGEYGTARLLYNKVLDLDPTNKVAREASQSTLKAYHKTRITSYLPYIELDRLVLRPSESMECEKLSLVLEGRVNNRGKEKPLSVILELLFLSNEGEILDRLERFAFTGNPFSEDGRMQAGSSKEFSFCLQAPGNWQGKLGISVVNVGLPLEEPPFNGQVVQLATHRPELNASWSGTSTITKTNVNKRVIRVGSDMTYEPFESIDAKTNKPIGFDIELMEELGKVIGAKIEFVNTHWDHLIPDIHRGAFDILISAMTITPQRAQVLTFSDPYFITGQVIVVKKGTSEISNPENLRDRIIAVQLGTSGHLEAEKIAGIKRIDKYPTILEVVSALKQGKADAAVIDEVVALGEVRLNPDEIEIVSQLISKETYGMAVYKGKHNDLLQLVNAALKKVREDGTYDRLYQKWFPTIK